jgi:hypothetical protein
MKKKILLALLAIVAIGGAIGFYLYNKPAERTVSADAEFTVQAPALFSEFENNEGQANSKYLNKVVAVQGKVLSIAKGDSAGVSITLEAGSEMFGVSCLVPEVGETANLKEGDNITVKGLCTGMLMDVVLVKCRVEK